MSAKRRHRSSAEYLKYLKGELSREERHSLERELERDPFQQEAMEGFEQITHGEAEEDLLSLHASLRKRITRRKRVAWYSIAATVASILVVGTIFLNIYHVNPEARQEPVSEEEALLRETAPEPEKSVAPDALERADEGQKAGMADQKAEAADEADDVVLEDLDFNKEAPEEELAYELDEEAAPLPAEAPAQEAQAVAAVVQDDEAVAKQEVEVAPDDEAVAKGDAVVAVEAVPQAREETDRSRKVARQAVPQAMEKRAPEEEMAAGRLTGLVSGVVVSAEDMNPLPGASIYLQGADSGTVTDMQGRFTFPASPEVQNRVTASYVGMLTGEYQLASGEENRLVMQPDQTALNEVVVVASGSAGRTNPTDAVRNVNMEQPDDFAVYQGAEPSGGIGAYKMYMEKNIRFPAGDEFGKREVVVLGFHVARDGSISGIQTLRSPGQVFSDEAIRLLKEGPAWNPARGEDGPVDDEVRMRIVFRK
jgi:hypothetical protein